MDELYSSFDLGFSDTYTRPGESARLDSFLKRLPQLRIVDEILEEESDINYTLWYSLPKGNPVGELWLEHQTDLRASIYLSLGGYYRQAISTLRNWLELCLVGVYYDRHWQDRNSRYDQWKKGIKKSPRNFENDLLVSIFGREPLKTIEKQFKFRSSLTVLHRQLSAHVHNSGDVGTKLQKGRDNVPRFIRRSFERWYTLLRRTFTAIVVVFALSYQGLLRGYYMKKRGNLIRLMGKSKEVIQLLDELLVSQSIPRRA